MSTSCVDTIRYGHPRDVYTLGIGQEAELAALMGNMLSIYKQEGEVGRSARWWPGVVCQFSEGEDLRG